MLRGRRRRGALGCQAVLAAVAALCLAPPAQALNPPVLSTSQAITRNPPQLSWPAVSGAAKYSVLRGATCASTASYATTAATSFTDYFVAPTPATYAYTVVAVDATGTITSSPSNCVVVVYDDQPPRVELTANAQHDGSVVLAWTVADSTAVTLTLRRGAANDGPPGSPSDGSAVCPVTPATTTCTDRTAVSGARYAYALFATDAAGNIAAHSDSALALDVEGPSSPQGLAAVPGVGQLALSWTPVPATGTNADVAGYRVVIKAGGTPPVSVTDGTTVCDLPSATVGTCTATGLTGGALVSATVFARDEVPNWSLPSGTASTTSTPMAPPAPPPPPPPTPPQPSVVDRQPPGRPTHVSIRISATGVRVAWHNPSAPDLDHLVLVRNSHHRPHTPSDGTRTNVARASHLAIAAERGERFHLALYAYDHAGNVSQPAAVDVTVPQIFPLAGTSFQVAPLLSWATVPRASYYNVVVRRAGKRVAVGWPTNPTWRPPRLRPGVYRWYVWPGFGPKERAAYGDLIGSSTFRIR